MRCQIILGALAGLSAATGYGYNTTSTWGYETTTAVYTAITTVCPTPTTLTYGDKTYTVSSSTTLTITDCPCTLTHTKAMSTGYAPTTVTSVATYTTYTTCPSGFTVTPTTGTPYTLTTPSVSTSVATTTVVGQPTVYTTSVAVTTSAAVSSGETVTVPVSSAAMSGAVSQISDHQPQAPTSAIVSVMSVATTVPVVSMAPTVVSSIIGSGVAAPSGVVPTAPATSPIYSAGASKQMAQAGLVAGAFGLAALAL